MANFSNVVEGGDHSCIEANENHDSFSVIFGHCIFSEHLEFMPSPLILKSISNTFSILYSNIFGSVFTYLLKSFHEPERCIMLPIESFSEQYFIRFFHLLSLSSLKFNWSIFLTETTDMWIAEVLWEELFCTFFLVLMKWLQIDLNRFKRGFKLI